MAKNRTGGAGGGLGRGGGAALAAGALASPPPPPPIPGGFTAGQSVFYINSSGGYSRGIVTGAGAGGTVAINVAVSSGGGTTNAPPTGVVDAGRAPIPGGFSQGQQIYIASGIQGGQAVTVLGPGARPNTVLVDDRGFPSSITTSNLSAINPYSNGQPVRLNSGVYAGKIGSVVGTTANGRLQVLVQGRVVTLNQSSTSAAPGQTPTPRPAAPTPPPTPASAQQVANAAQLRAQRAAQALAGQPQTITPPTPAPAAPAAVQAAATQATPAGGGYQPARIGTTGDPIDATATHPGGWGATPPPGTTGNPGLAHVAAAQGFTGKPQLRTSQELDADIASGDIEVFRGLSASGRTPGSTFANDYRNGDYYAGNGIFGHGHYAAGYNSSRSRAGAISVAKKYKGNSNGALIRMAIRKDAKIVDHDDIEREKIQWRSDNQSAIRRLETAQRTGRLSTADQADLDRRRRADFALSDVGAFAASRGYDVIRVSPGAAKSQSNGTGSTPFYVILNRTATKVQDGPFIG